MANRYFNKQVAESRKPLASGSMVKGVAKKAISEVYKPKGEFSKKNKKSGKPVSHAGGPIPEGLKEALKKRKQERAQKRMKNSKPESPERKKRQADYMKKHGKKPSSRKTLSVTNSYKKEVEGLK